MTCAVSPRCSGRTSRPTASSGSRWTSGSHCPTSPSAGSQKTSNPIAGRHHQVGHPGSMRSMSADPEITIEDALARFLDSQRPRLAPRTFRRYEDVVELLAHCLNGYGHSGLSELERKRFEHAYQAGDE